MEDVLRKVVPGITIPYWAWEDEPRNQQFSSSVWNPVTGLGGGSGGGAAGVCVPNGGCGLTLLPQTFFSSVASGCTLPHMSQLRLPSRSGLNHVDEYHQRFRYLAL
jgi:hypothetical protein